MMFISPRNYQQGTCFGCQVCLFCGQDLTYKNCNCELSKPTKNNRTAEVPNVRNMNYKPDKTPIAARDFLSCSNEKFEYKLNMNHYYFLSLCSACNSQINRNVKKVVEKE